jgi:hypothetical protein
MMGRKELLGGDEDEMKERKERQMQKRQNLPPRKAPNI